MTLSQLFSPNGIASPRCQPTVTLSSSAREPHFNASRCDVVRSLGPAWLYAEHGERLRSLKCHLMVQVLLACLFLCVREVTSSPILLGSFRKHHSGSILTTERPETKYLNSAEFSSLDCERGNAVIPQGFIGV